MKDVPLSLGNIILYSYTMIYGGIETKCLWEEKRTHGSFVIAPLFVAA